MKRLKVNAEKLPGLWKKTEILSVSSSGGQFYKALFDPGAMLSLVGPTVAAKFEDRLEESNAAIRTVTGGVTRVLGTLKVML